MPSSPTANIRLLRLFIISYAPLAILILIQTWPSKWALSLSTIVSFALLLVSLWGLVDAWRLPRQSLRRGAHAVELVDINDEGGAVAAYLATYLLPFLGLSFIGWQSVISVSVYLAILFMVFIRSDLALVNPTLYLFGWRVVSGKRDTTDGPRRILCLIPHDSEIRSGQSRDFVDFGQFLVLKQ